MRRLWPTGWRQHLAIVRPETVVGWHRKGWRLYWTWRSRAPLGRPRLSAEVRELIAAMSRDNPLWGTERIRGELLKLSIVVSNRSIRRYRWRKQGGHHRGQTWRTFLRNQVQGIWAADLFVVQTVGFRTVYAFFFITHDRRQLVDFSVTASPTAAWIWQQVINATPWGLQPRYLIHDRDAVYGGEFGSKLAKIGVAGVRTPIRAPRANSVAERVIRTIRQEALDHVIVLNERHLHAILSEFFAYYNHERPHRSLRMAPPVYRPREGTGAVTARPVLGGLHHVYSRAA
jgi:transposase InsO family protein